MPAEMESPDSFETFKERILLLNTSMPKQQLEVSLAFTGARKVCITGVRFASGRRRLYLEFQLGAGHTSHFTPGVADGCRAVVAIHLRQGLSVASLQTQLLILPHLICPTSRGPELCCPFTSALPSLTTFLKSETSTLVCPSLSWWLRVSPLPGRMNLLG